MKNLTMLISRKEFSGFPILQKIPQGVLHHVIEAIRENRRLQQGRIQSRLSGTRIRDSEKVLPCIKEQGKEFAYSKCPAPEDLVMWAGTLYGYFFTMSCQL